MSHEDNGNNGSGGGARRLATVSNVIIDVTEKFYVSLLDFVKNFLAQYNVHISDIEPSRDEESCVPLTGFNTCTVIRTMIFLSFDHNISKCEMEYLVVDYLGSVADSLFDSYNVNEVWPKMGRSNSQFFITDRDRLPDADETKAFEGVLSTFLTDAFDDNQEQQFSSLCVDVIDTDFIEHDESQDVAVTARSAPIYPITKRPHKRPRDDKDELEYDEYILEKRSSYTDDADSTPAATSTHDLMNTDFVENDESQEVVVTARSAPIYANKKRPHERLRDDKEELKYEEYNIQQRSNNAYNAMLRRRYQRTRGHGEGYAMPSTETVSTKDDAPRARDSTANEKGDDYVSPKVHRGRRPRRMIMQQDNERSLQEEPTRTGTVKLDTVVTGRYRGPKIDDMDRKINDAVSGNEYQIEEALEEADPDYYDFDDGGLQLSLEAPSRPVLGASISDDKDIGQEKKLKMPGYVALGCGTIFFALALIHYGWRRKNGDDDKDISESHFSLQSICINPNGEDNTSTTDSATSSLSAPPTTTESVETSLSTPSSLSSPPTTTDSIASSLSTPSTSSMPSTAISPSATPLSILRRQESSILNKARSGGTGKRRRVRWALGLDEKSSESKSGMGSVGGTAPGAYSVKSDSSDNIMSAGKLSAMWRKEGGYDTLNDEDSVNVNTADYSDEEEGIISGPSSVEESGSFAQFSIFGTALMCKQQDDMTITTDLYSTALLMEDDATVTTDNRSFLGQDYHGYIDEEEGR